MRRVSLPVLILVALALGVVAAQQPQVVSLRTDNIVEPGQVGGGLVDVRRPDPVAVAGADIAVVRQ